jgi:hypothetical protein
MAQNLNDYLAENRCEAFHPIPHYFPTGDYLTYYFRDLPCHAKRVDDLLTVYLAFDTNELVGVKIKGVKALLQELGAFGVRIDRADVSLDVFVTLGRATAKDEAQRRRSGRPPPWSRTQASAANCWRHEPAWACENPFSESQVYRTFSSMRKAPVHP